MQIKYMTELPHKWKSLRLHQKIKYIAELIAICGGLIVLFLMVRQNAINYEMLKSTFPLEIESALIDYADRKPLV